MIKRVISVFCGLLLCISLVGLVFEAAVQGTLLNEKNAQNAMEQSGYVAETTAQVREKLAGFFTDAGLDSALIEEAVSEELVRELLWESARYWSIRRDPEADDAAGRGEYEGLFAPVGEAAIAELEADGSTVTAQGLEQIEALVTLSEQTLDHMTMVPMVLKQDRLNNYRGTGSGTAAIVVCAVLAALAVAGIVWAAIGERAVGLYLGSGLLGAGLAILAPTFILNLSREDLGPTMDLMRGDFSLVAERYYAPFYTVLLVVGGVLAACGLVLIVVRLVKMGKS